ncbi:MAG: metalloregulator ArsR/SmtB family transcription factor [Dehalococcoidia bacterium]|nr:metalloregulator ArsR/SmtB family transcription factor [Dehalococcoidia bacterium]
MNWWPDLRELKLALKSLADTSRLRIVERLADGREVKVFELALSLRISQPLLSWHLRSLKRAGLVNTRREGRVVYCSLNLNRLAWCQEELAMLTGTKKRALVT